MPIISCLLSLYPLWEQFTEILKTANITIHTKLHANELSIMVKLSAVRSIYISDIKIAHPSEEEKKPAIYFIIYLKYTISYP